MTTDSTRSLKIKGTSDQSKSLNFGEAVEREPSIQLGDPELGATQTLRRNSEEIPQESSDSTNSSPGTIRPYPVRFNRLRKIVEKHHKNNISTESHASTINTGDPVPLSNASSEQAVDANPNVTTEYSKSLGAINGLHDSTPSPSQDISSQISKTKPSENTQDSDEPITLPTSSTSKPLDMSAIKTALARPPLNNKSTPEERRLSWADRVKALSKLLNDKPHLQKVMKSVKEPQREAGLPVLADSKLVANQIPSVVEAPNTNEDSVAPSITTADESTTEEPGLNDEPDKEETANKLEKDQNEHGKCLLSE